MTKPVGDSPRGERKYFIGVSKFIYERLQDLALRNKMTVQQVVTAILENDPAITIQPSTLLRKKEP